MKGKKKFWKKSDGIKILTVIASIMVIVSSIIVIWAAITVGEVFVKTKPDLRVKGWLMLTGASGGC